jgi:hypothetical protein
MYAAINVSQECVISDVLLVAGPLNVAERADGDGL